MGVKLNRTAVVTVRLNGEPPVEANIVTVTMPVGVTSVWYAACLTAISVVALVWLLLRTARGNPKIPGATPWLRVLASSDGYVSLSQAQIMLWSLLVFAGGIYVLTLSGTLIGLTSGTLTLLGIQGATTLLARTDGLPGVSAAPAGGTKLKHDPAWSDLVTVDGDPPQIDVTRVQAVIATVLAAVYVAMSMFHNYEIPEIPQNFLILMGISNGIYLTGRLLPNTSRNR